VSRHTKHESLITTDALKWTQASEKRPCSVWFFSRLFETPRLHVEAEENLLANNLTAVNDWNKILSCDPWSLVGWLLLKHETLSIQNSCM